MQNLQAALAIPMPGEEFQSLMVVASGWLTDTEDECTAALLVINTKTPGDFYNILEIEYLHEWQILRVETGFANIVPAAKAFDENYGFWNG